MKRKIRRRKSVRAHLRALLRKRKSKWKHKHFFSLQSWRNMRMLSVRSDQGAKSYWNEEANTLYDYLPQITLCCFGRV